MLGYYCVKRVLSDPVVMKRVRVKVENPRVDAECRCRCHCDCNDFEAHALGFKECRRAAEHVKTWL